MPLQEDCTSGEGVAMAESNFCARSKKKSFGKKLACASLRRPQLHIQIPAGLSNRRNLKTDICCNLIIMAKIKKKGEAGSATNYITRNQAIRKLQINLGDFRKLCIYKGIFPREPRSRKRVSKKATAHTTFYYRKDIQFLLHEPLLQKFRDQKVLERKISRALGRGDYTDAKRLDGNAARPEKTGKPTYTLNHIVRERYPTFIDALRDLDDCLSMLFLFANLPSTPEVPAKMVARCERLCLEFQHYLIVSHSLRKSFLSIKGIYYQANIQGEDILWLVPYKFNTQIVGDIDFRVMGTFVEFYMTVLGFVNFRLYTSAGLKYPPKFDQAKDDLSGELDALKVELDRPAPLQTSAPKALEGNASNPEAQQKINKLIEDMAAEDARQDIIDQSKVEDDAEIAETLDKLEPAIPGGDVLHQPSYSTTDPGKLFANCTIYLSRETPRAALEFILRAFGCKRIGWDAVLGEGAFTHDELDPRITHQIVDRPVTQAAISTEGDGEDNQTAQKLGPNMRVPGRFYIQPQWVWDSINDEELKNVNQYVPGAALPPHLSPFVKRAPGQYDPTIPLEEQEGEGEGLEDSDVESDPDEDEVGTDQEDFAVKNVLENVDGSEDEDGEAGENDRESFGGFSDAEKEVAVASDDEGDVSINQRQDELNAEMQGNAVKENGKSNVKAEARKKLATKAKQDAEELERRKGMMSKKKRRRYEKMEYGINKRNAEAEALRSKRRKIEKELAKKKT